MNRLFFTLLTVLVPGIALAIQIEPSDDVTSSVIVRQYPTTQDSDILGRLLAGQQAELIESVPYWRKVRLADGIEGYVSKRWTKIVPAASQATPFEIHFVDVGVGDGIIFNMDDKEIVFDGGNYSSVLHDYAAKTMVIDDPIELAIVTHSDFDHWKGMVRLLNLDGKATNSYQVQEFWEPGFNRVCRPLPSYDAFLDGVKNLVGLQNFHRPLEATHEPATKSGKVEPFTLPSFPGVTFTLLHSDRSPVGSDCAYRINDASIVLLVEVSGIRIIFTGDENGKERDEASPGTPSHVESKLLELERRFPGTLKADILKAPHHGSETASTQEFIDKVNPRYVIISASTRHNLPRDTVLDRYKSTQRVVLRTDANREKNNDHIYCSSVAFGQIQCNYKDSLD
jgi:beta-lactamase superfamily II metal-dependent hydrolase